jgi:hypothetical protein
MYVNERGEQEVRRNEKEFAYGNSCDWVGTCVK